MERDANRYKTLQEMVGYSGAENVVTIQGDVTRLELDKYKDVEYILLDPSCSGSGMLSSNSILYFMSTLQCETPILGWVKKLILFFD